MAWATKASDSFNKGNGPLDTGGREILDNANGGSGTWTWVQIGGGWSISSGSRIDILGSTSLAHADGTTGSNDQAAEIVVTDTSTIAGGVVIRWTSGTGVGNGYLLYADIFNVGTLFLFEFTNGSFSSLNTGSYTLSNNDVMRIEAVGTSIVGLVNGVSKVTATDSNHGSGVGAVYGDAVAGQRFDNFKYEEQSGSTGSPWLTYRQMMMRQKTKIDRTWKRDGLLWTPSYAMRKAA